MRLWAGSHQCLAFARSPLALRQNGFMVVVVVGSNGLQVVVVAMAGSSSNISMYVCMCVCMYVCMYL